MGSAALKLAIDLMHFPAQARSIRSAPLPDDVLILLRIASGDKQTTRKAAESAGRCSNVIREAAVFFIEQMMLYPGADSYRVLGASPEATAGELRRNMVLLLRWLHPDLDRRGEHTMFAARVTRAWDDLKTKERREAYDRSRCMSRVDESLARKKGDARTQLNTLASKRRWNYGKRPGRHAFSRKPLQREPRGLLHRVLLLLFSKAAL